MSAMIGGSSIQAICAKCDKVIGTHLLPCHHCGHQHPLTEAGKEWVEKLKKEGYFEMYGIKGEDLTKKGEG